MLDLLVAAFDGDFAAEDWAHTFGGTRFLVYADGRPVAHAAVVPRRIEVGGVAYAAGYVEGVAVLPELQGSGLGRRVMTVATEQVRAAYEIGVLSTDRPGFYERLGWERWGGPSYVRDGHRLRRTADEDDGLMVLRAGFSATVPLTASITCEARPGDDW